MYSFKENSYPPSPLHFKTPYSRVSVRKPDPTTSKILSKQRTSENSYGRSLIPAKHSSLRNTQNGRILRNYEAPSTSWAALDDFYGTTVSYSESFKAEYEPPQFRQLGNVTLESSFDHSLELKMMSIDDNGESWESSKKSKVQKETAGKGFQIKPRQSQLRVFTGSVENVLHWSKLKNNHHILFEVTGTVISVEQGKWKSEKVFYLSDSKSGPKLQVLYQEIDRPLPGIVANSLVTCFGRLTARNRLQAYKVEESSEEKKKDLQRLSFICNRVAEELAAASQTKSFSM